MSVNVGQTYRDNDKRFQGRTLRVVGVEGDRAVLEVVANAADVQHLLDDPDGEPGTRSYTPEDRRGKTTKISVARLEGTGFSLVEQGPDVVGPVA